ncbi:hypothetical protein [Microseira wollei]|nr:hypothetical protein [Microseira wollei]
MTLEPHPTVDYGCFSSTNSTSKRKHTGKGAATEASEGSKA